MIDREGTEYIVVECKCGSHEQVPEKLAAKWGLIPGMGTRCLKCGNEVIPRIIRKEIVTK